MAPGIPTGFVRKLYRILDHESALVVSWDADGASFSVHDSAALDAQILPRYFRGRLCAFRQQLVDHGFERCDCEEDESREQYKHADFQRGQPGRLSKIERNPKRTPSKSRVETPKPRLCLKVTLNVPAKDNRKRLHAQETHETENKRIRSQQQSQKNKNPLFSDDPEPGMALAKFVEGSGLLPDSSELPDPISYLSKVGAVGNGMQQVHMAPSVAEPTVPMFSDDMVRSALFFLVSSSCTGVEGTAATEPTLTSTPATTASVLPTAATTSTSGFLAALLASSSTGGTAVAPFTRGNNPLFNDQATDGDEDSIWNILVSSSVDRVRSAIDGVESQQEKLRLILQEREKLEEQRKKVGAPAGPIIPKRLTTESSPQPTAAMENSRSQKQQNPLFAADTGGSSADEHSKPAEDDLWKLLMSSSIDCFRRVDLGL